MTTPVSNDRLAELIAATIGRDTKAALLELQQRRALDQTHVLVPRIPTVAMRMPWHRQGGFRHASFFQKWKAMLEAVERDRAMIAAMPAAVERK